MHSQHHLHQYSMPCKHKQSTLRQQQPLLQVPYIALIEISISPNAHVIYIDVNSRGI